MDLAPRCGGPDARPTSIGGDRVQGRVGDRIVVETEKVGQRDRVGEILEVRELPSGVDYRVRWEDGHVSEIRPKAGSARIEPAPGG